MRKWDTSVLPPPVTSSWQTDLWLWQNYRSFKQREDLKEVYKYQKSLTSILIVPYCTKELLGPSRGETRSLTSNLLSYSETPCRKIYYRMSLELPKERTVPKSWEKEVIYVRFRIRFNKRSNESSKFERKVKTYKHTFLKVTGIVSLKLGVLKTKTFIRYIYKVYNF